MNNLEQNSSSASRSKMRMRLISTTLAVTPAIAMMLATLALDPDLKLFHRDRQFGGHYEVAWQRGLVLESYTAFSLPGEVYGTFEECTPWYNAREPVSLECLGFKWVHVHYLHEGPVNGGVSYTQDLGVWRRATIPTWFAALFASAIPFFFLLMQGRRYGPGQCRVCGYDMRATPDRCPECGGTSEDKGAQRQDATAKR